MRVIFAATLMWLLVSCTDNPFKAPPLPVEDLIFFSYIFADTSEGTWASCQRFVQTWPSLENVSVGEITDCATNLICQEPEQRSKLLEYIRSRSKEDLYLEFISMVSRQTEEDIIRSCRKFINHIDYPDLNKVDFSVFADCADYYVCQDEEGRSAFMNYLHRYLQAL